MSGFSSQSIQASLVRPSKFRYLNGFETKSERHENVLVNNTLGGGGQKLSNTLKTNGEFYALPTSASGGGSLAFKYFNNESNNNNSGGSGGSIGAGIGGGNRWDEKVQNYGVIKAHRGRLSDFDLSPFRGRDELLSVSSSDNVIRYWKLNSNSDIETSSSSSTTRGRYKTYEEMDCDLELIDQNNSSNKSISRVLFNPVCDHSIVSVQGDLIQFWDLEKKKIFHTIQNQSQSSTNSTVSTSSLPIAESGLSFNEQGTMMICGTSGDRLIRIYDLRANSSNSSNSSSLIASCEAHSSMKPFQTLYCGASGIGSGSASASSGDFNSNILCSIGFSKSGQRELATYDLRYSGGSSTGNSSGNSGELKCLQRLPIDSSASSGGSILTPFYDPDIKLLYLVGRGDQSIKFYELESGIFHYLNDYTCQQQQSGGGSGTASTASVDWFPKWKLNVSNFELSKFVRLTNDRNVELVSMRVSRKSNIEQYFQEDLFPNTWNGLPNYSNTYNWMDTINGSDDQTKESSRIKMSLKPDDKISIYDVPVSEGGKIRPSTSASSNLFSKLLLNNSNSTPTTGTSGGGQQVEDNSDVPTLPSDDTTTIEQDDDDDLIIKTTHSNNTNTTNSRDDNNDVLFSPTAEEASKKSLSIGLVSNMGHSIALASYSPPSSSSWYSRLFGGMGYYLGMTMFLLFKFTFISIPVYIYRKSSGYKPPPLMERFEKEVMPIIGKNSSKNVIKKDIPKIDISNMDNTPIIETPQTPIMESLLSSTPPIASQHSSDISREYGRIIMEDYILPLTKQDIFPKRSQDSNSELLSKKVLEIDITDLKKGLTHILIWIKGRKKTRALLAPYYWTSLNHNDCFIMDCGKIVYIYNGQYSNKLCRAKALDLSQMIRFKERGGDCQVVIIDGVDMTSQSGSQTQQSQSTQSDITPLVKRQIAQFWKELGLSGGELEFNQLLELHYPKIEISTNGNVLSKLKLEKSKYTSNDEISDDTYQQLSDLSQRLYKLNSNIFEEFPLMVLNNSEQESQDDYITRIAPHMLNVIKLNQIPGGEITSLDQLNQLFEISKNSNEISKNSNIFTCQQPSHHVLHTDQCYLFENLFSNEVFFWSGKSSNLNIRKWGLAMARKLAQYRSQHDNPFSLKNPIIQRFKNILSKNGNNNNTSTNLEGSSGSGHHLANNRKYLSSTCRVIEEGEHSLFKQHFSDYPGSLMIQTLDVSAKGNVAEKKIQKSINFSELIKNANTIMEKSNSKNSIDPYLVSSASTIYSSKIRMWRVSDFQKIPYPHIGHFYTGDAFILLYSYTKVEGGKSFHKIFFWQGRDIKKKDGGTSAYKTVEIGEMLTSGSGGLDGEDMKGAVVEQQVRVVQDKEPKIFLDLFCNLDENSNENSNSGSSGGNSRYYYVVHKGKYRPSVLESYENVKQQQPTTPTTPTTPISSSSGSVGSSNATPLLDENNEKKFSPQLLQYQSELIQSIISKPLINTTTGDSNMNQLVLTSCYDVRCGKIIETDDLHPNYLNPNYILLFTNLNFNVLLNRIQENTNLENTNMEGDENTNMESVDNATVIIYYGMNCKKEEESKFILNYLQSFKIKNIITIYGNLDELLNLVFKNVDPTFEYFISRFGNYLNKW